jgi:hypothetical protein
MGYVDELVGLVTRCKRQAKQAGGTIRKPDDVTVSRDEEKKSEHAKAREERRKEREKLKEREHEREREMWKERGARVCLILASQLVEMKVSLFQQPAFRAVREFFVLTRCPLGIYSCSSASPSPRASATS